ncbi:hypothetical protein [Desulfuribacillus alkaliarsenatis]|uniref:Uncharacterized protein n=1 Tax=Desulfuribacillus alkaliarsenatis TaxID=766136 RepID=A0A1E5FZZ7_9FIRM|nr:hypothetical protein [Desulfuribacillus alkaliarsenatis]OEF96134.1 hypothetical protein BHF68_10405 [Desulfuribacillus alkaliarsenatis]
MSVKSLAFLSIRVLSICFIAIGVRYIGNVVSISLPGFMGVNDPGYFEMFIRFSIPAIVLFVIGVILWIFAGGISNFLVLKETNIKESTHIDIEKVEAFVYSFFGLIIILISIPELIQNISQATIQATIINKEIFMYQRHIWYSNIIVEIIKISLGIFLVLQANTIKKILKRLREMGT